MKQQSQYIPAILSIVVLCITGGVYFLFSNSFAKYISSKKIEYYHYQMPEDLSVIDTSTLPPATSVPVLMYHGITKKTDSENTSLNNFKKTMELLKEDGFETITANDLFLFKKGLFTLPKKPILITFDDGRKDSYYPTDDIFKQLGFKATIFVATGPSFDGNSFYLTKEELIAMNNSGRWEIQAHGRYSHKHIRISENPEDEEGRFLSSKVYLSDKQRFETTEEFVNRITEDYVNGDADVKEVTGNLPLYFAIPLNDYGEYPVSNFPESKSINTKIVTDRYRLAFIQANENEDPSNIVATPYNLKDEPFFSIRRLEVKNMSPEEVLSVLHELTPGAPNRVLGETVIKRLAQQHFSGTVTAIDGGYDLTADESGMNALLIMGEPFWKNYSVHASFMNDEASTVGLIARYVDDDNYLICGVSEGSPFLREKINGLSYTRATSNESVREQEIVADMTLSDQKVSCSINGISVGADVKITQKKGFAGIKAWDKEKSANIIIHDFRVKS